MSKSLRSPSRMYLRILLVIFSLVSLFRVINTQRQWVPPTTTAAEMWNPYTWYWPYAIAASEGYRNYFQNAQQITNQLYMQAYNTNAFWWTNQNRPGNGTGGVTGGNTGGATGGGSGTGTGTGGNTGGATGGGSGTGTGTGGNTGGATGGGSGTGTGTGGATGGNTGGNTGGTGNQPVANMAQGGQGWN